MTYVTFLICLVSAARAQMLTTGEASEGYVSLFNGRDLGQWVGDQRRWKVERGVLTGTSDGKSASTAVLGGRDYGDFELRFDLRIKHGAGGVQMRGSGMGPLGVELEVDTSAVRWLVNGSSFVIVSSIKPGEWGAYRIVCKGGSFDVIQNESKTANTVVVGHLPPRGKILLIMPTGEPSDIEFRNIRLKELGD
jgi:hypothetical protein